MRYTSIILILCAHGFMTACNHNATRPNESIDSLKISDELARTYFQEIQLEFSLFDTLVVMPGIGCSGCMDRTLEWIAYSRLRSTNYKLIFDSAFQNKIEKKYEFKNIIYDLNNKMSGYEFGIGYPHMIIIDSPLIKVIPYNIEGSSVFDGVSP